MDATNAIPEFLEDFITEYRRIAIHRMTGFSDMQSILYALEPFDRCLKIEREPYEAEILLTLDLVERGRRAKTVIKPKKPPA